MTDLASTIKSSQDKLVVAGFVRGSGSHIAWEMFMHAANLPAASINWVPYDSVGDGVTAVLGGHGAVTIAYVDLVKDYVTAGQLRVIGVMADKRLEELHEVPTLKEQGIDVATAWQQWRGVIGPKNMPDAVKLKLADAIQKALSSPDLQAYMKGSSLVQDFKGPAEFTQFAHEQNAVTVDWLKRLGMAR